MQRDTFGQAYLLMLQRKFHDAVASSKTITWQRSQR